MLVVGERELTGGDLTSRTRQGEQLAMSLDGFLERLAAEAAGKPHRPANTPRAVSKRPTFVG